MASIVLVHGGGFASSCWDLLVEHLEGPVLAVDLPGRGAHPVPLESVTIGTAAASVAADVDRAGFDEIVLVGHSLAGCSLPATIGLLGDRVHHAVFVACTVPEDGQSSFDTLSPDIKARAQAASDDNEPGVLSPDLARRLFGNDLDDDQFAWCHERMVPEALNLVTEPVDLSPLHTSQPQRTWVRTLRDAIVDPVEQLQFANNVGDCKVIDLDAGHMCMISKPADLAQILNDIATNT
jgi:pimeloyl-ACP methyl ester carboxylesterase